MELDAKKAIELIEDLIKKVQMSGADHDLINEGVALIKSELHLNVVPKNSK
jgi:hypothetical protein